MKTKLVTYKNIFTDEIVIAQFPPSIKIIDGVEFMHVMVEYDKDIKLMRKDALKRIK